MDTLTYRTIIEQVLSVYTRIPSAVGEIETVLISDHDGDRYLLVVQGWQKSKRVYFTLAHVELVDEHVIIQHDRTEDGIAVELRQAGISSQDIVCAYLQPNGVAMP
jgi:hypothetical protein